MSKKPRNRRSALLELAATKRSLWKEARADGWRSTAVSVCVVGTLALALILIILVLFSAVWYLMVAASVIGIFAQRRAVDDFLDLAEYLDHKNTNSTA